MNRLWLSNLRRALRTALIAPTRVDRAWTRLVAVLLAGASLVRFARGLTLPVRLPSGRWLWLADISEMRVLHEIFCDGIYDVPALPSSVDVIIDLGANVGAASVFFAERFPSAHIVAYEADPQVARRATRNVRGLPIVVHTAAVVGERGPVKLRRSRGASWGTSAHVASGEEFEVPGILLDDIVHVNGKVDILKMDIEGSEYAALSACSELDQVGLILGEFHPIPGVTATEFFGLLTSQFELLSGGGSERATFVARLR